MSPAYKHSGYGKRQGGERGRGIGNQDLRDLRKECFSMLGGGDWCSGIPSSVPGSLWLSDLGI